MDGNSAKLTKREEKIVALIATGMKNKEIQATMGARSEHIVKNWIRAIYDKSGFSNRIEIALWYVRYREKLQRQDGIDFEL